MKVLKRSKRFLAFTIAVLLAVYPAVPAAAASDMAADAAESNVEAGIGEASVGAPAEENADTADRGYGGEVIEYENGGSSEDETAEEEPLIDLDDLEEDAAAGNPEETPAGDTTGALTGETVEVLDGEDGGVTDAIDSYINLVGDQDAFYGGEIITIYNNVLVSGNQTTVEEGAYTVISLPKDKFQKPKEGDVSTAFDNFKDLEIKETDDAYEIITTYKTMYGGHSSGVPVRINLLPRMTVNQSENIVKQQFFDKNGKKLTTESQLVIKGKARLESLSNNTNSASRLKTEVDKNYVIKAGTERTFSVSYSSPNSNENDPRDRRIYASIPEGTRVKEGTGWTLEPETGRYYKDVSRDRWSSPSITLDLGGIDMSAFDSEKKVKRFQVDFTTQPVVEGVPQTDLGPYKAYCYRDYYILKEEPPAPGEVGASIGSSSTDTYAYNKTIDENYQPVSGGLDPRGSWRYGSGYYSDRNLTYCSYNRELLHTQRIRYTHQNVSNFYISYEKGDEKTQELSIRSSKIQVSPYTIPNEVRLMVMGLSAEDTATVEAMLQGTKAYGVTAGGEKTLITDNVPIVSYDKYVNSHTADGWQEFSGGEGYSYILFEYPETLKFVGKPQIQNFYSSIWSDVTADIKEEAYDVLAEKLGKGESPVISYQGDYDTTEITAKFVVKKGEEPSEHRKSLSDSTRDEFRMQYEEAKRTNPVKVTNGSQFFVDDTITTRLSYTQYRYGNFADATTSQNLNIYYLVPDGLEPIEDKNVFDSIEVIRGYQDGFNLVVAKPKTLLIPESTGAINGERQNSFELSFLATRRLETKTYRIYSCMSFDNNKIGVAENGDQYGILQSDTPSGVWAEILKDAKNRPDDPKKFTLFESTSFTIYPPLVLSSIKQVKLSSEPDSKYASSIGKKATMGTPVDYRLLLKNNSSRDIHTLEIIDILPFNGDKAIVPNDDGAYVSRGSKFKTPLLSVEESDKFDIYYSTDAVKETTAENAHANWSAAVDDMSKVTMIKAVLKKGEKIATKETCSIVTHNVIENNARIQDGEKAYNSFALTLNEGNSYIEALRVEVMVTYPKKDVVIEKSDLNIPDKKLYNAVFTLYEKGTDLLIKDNITTNHDGLATIPDLLVGKEYYLIEKQAPDGYALSDQKIEFKVEEKTVENPVQKVVVSNDVYRTSVSVRKEWIGPAADSAVVKLMNKEQEVARQLLNEENGWEYTFTDLRKYGADGQEILYSVEEEPMAGYTSVIDGNMADGFTVINTNAEKISIPVTKVWVGPAADKAEISLNADGKAIRKKELTEADQWTGIFESLPKYDEKDGHEIEYTLSEVSVSEYSTAITGDVANGFVVTNTKIEKPGENPDETPEEPQKPEQPQQPQTPEKESEKSDTDMSSAGAHRPAKPGETSNVSKSDNSGNVSRTAEKQGTPKTGDHSNVIVCILFLVLSGAMLALVIVSGKKRNTR